MTTPSRPAWRVDLDALCERIEKAEREGAPKRLTADDRALLAKAIIAVSDRITKIEQQQAIARSQRNGHADRANLKGLIL